MDNGLSSPLFLDSRPCSVEVRFCLLKGVGGVECHYVDRLERFDLTNVVVAILAKRGGALHL